MPRGPKTDLNREIISKICGVLANMGTEKIACQALEIPKGTYDTWKIKGKRAMEKMKDGVELSENEQLYMEMVMQTRKARAQSEWGLSKTVAKQAKEQGDVRSAQWILKHLYNWSSKQKVEIDDKRDENAGDTIREILDDEEARGHAKELADKIMEKAQANASES